MSDVTIITLSPDDLRRMVLECIEQARQQDAAAAELRGERLTLAQVSKRLGIHRNTVRTYIRERGFPESVEGKWMLADVIKWERR